MFVPPKFQLSVYGLVPPDAVSVKVMVCPETGRAGLSLKLAVNFPMGETVMDWDDRTEVLTESATLRETVNVPDMAYA